MSDVTSSESRRASAGRDKHGRGKKRAPRAKTGSSTPRSKSPNDVGRALRSVYDATLGERVPDDFLDLLGKLS